MTSNKFKLKMLLYPDMRVIKHIHGTKTQIEVQIKVFNFTYIHIYIYTYVCMYTYIYTYTHIYVCIYIHIYVYTYIHIYVCMYVYLEKEMATYSSILAWRIPGTEETGGLPSMGSHRVEHC